MSAEAKEVFERCGYIRFPFEQYIATWATHAQGACDGILDDPSNAIWWRHQHTWFVGVDALPNDERGQLPGGPPLQGSAIDFIRQRFGFSGPWHRGQLSVCFPGYPMRDERETEQSHKYRMTRDAAHVDGLKGEGEPKRRHLREPHQFILGVPLNETEAGAAPFVIWEGSHIIMQEMFEAAFMGLHPNQWGDVDVTAAYQQTRRLVFETCRRVVVHAKPGEAYVAHRFSVHGVSPWIAETAEALSRAKRAIAYFRPPAG